MKGNGNQQDYGMRIYDNRLGRFLSVDPIGKNFAYYTTYQFAGNKPIAAIDIDGLEDVYVTTTKGNRTIMIKYDRTDINTIVSGGHAVLRVFYDNSEESVKQFEGPNKKNEKEIFTKVLSEQENFIKNDLVPNNLKNNGVTTSYGKTKPVLVPEPSPPAPAPTLNIKFQGLSDKFANDAEAIKQIKPLAEYLKQNPDASVDLFGNTGTSPGSTEPTGSGSDVLSIPTNLNGNDVTTGELMKARAASVENVLIKKYGISDSRINSKAGKQTEGESGRNVGVKIKK